MLHVCAPHLCLPILPLAPQLTQLGFSPMPDDVLSYTQSRAVPIILSNPKYKQVSQLCGTLWFGRSVAAAV